MKTNSLFTSKSIFNFYCKCICVYVEVYISLTTRDNCGLSLGYIKTNFCIPLGGKGNDS